MTGSFSGSNPELVRQDLPVLKFRKQKGENSVRTSSQSAQKLIYDPLRHTNKILQATRRS